MRIGCKLWRVPVSVTLAITTRRGGGMPLRRFERVTAWNAGSHIAVDHIDRFHLCLQLSSIRSLDFSTASKMLLLSSLLLLGAATVECSLLPPHPQLLNHFGAQGVNLWKLSNAPSSNVHGGNRESTGQVAFSVKPSEFEPHWFEQPLDHFSKNSETWSQRYWINTRHYKPREGAPVIVIDGGETSGEDRLPFLDTGIADILANATGGIGVILEHRYASYRVSKLNDSENRLIDTTVRVMSFLSCLLVCTMHVPGESKPVKNLTTDSLR